MGLNAMSAQTRTFADPKVESYIREGLKILKENSSDTSLGKTDIFPASDRLNASIERLDWWLNLRWYLHIYLTVNACSRAQWSMASESLDDAQACPLARSWSNTKLRDQWETFLRATVAQGNGRVDEALSLYQSISLQLPSIPSHKAQDAATELCVLAALNTVLILIDPLQANHEAAAAVHHSALAYVINHPNKSLRAAYDLLRSVLNPQDKLIDKKKHFHNCLSAARTVNNTQLVSIALSLMCTMFFKNVVGEQAQKSVTSARALADRSKSDLWRSVAAGLQESSALRHGNEVDAKTAARECERLVDALPKPIRSDFLLD